MLLLPQGLIAVPWFQRMNLTKNIYWKIMEFKPNVFSWAFPSKIVQIHIQFRNAIKYPHSPQEFQDNPCIQGFSWRIKIPFIFLLKIFFIGTAKLIKGLDIEEKYNVFFCNPYFSKSCHFNWVKNVQIISQSIEIEDWLEYGIRFNLIFKYS